MRRGATPAGLAARDTLRLEACFHLYGNDLSTERGPIEAGLGWACKEDTGFIGSEAVRAVREAGPTEKLVPFKLTGPGIARAGQPASSAAARSRAARSRRASASASAWPTCPPRAPTEGERFEIDVRGKTREAVVVRKPSTTRRPMAEASYPEELLYHADHDWARVDGDVATFGITWFAQDALGEVVFFDPPEVGSSVSAGRVLRRGRVRQGRVRRRSRRCRARSSRSTPALADAPEAINEDPYDDGWMVKVKLSDPSEADAPAGPRHLRGRPVSERLHRRHRRRTSS